MILLKIDVAGRLFGGLLVKFTKYVLKYGMGGFG